MRSLLKNERGKIWSPGTESQCAITELRCPLLLTHKMSPILEGQKIKMTSNDIIAEDGR